MREMAMEMARTGTGRESVISNALRVVCGGPFGQWVSITSAKYDFLFGGTATEPMHGFVAGGGLPGWSCG